MPTRRLVLPLAFPGLFLVYVATACYDYHQSVDTVASLIPAWQLAHHGTLNVDNFHHVIWFVRVHGRLVSNRFPGAIFLAVPFYWALSGGTSQPTYVPAALTAVVSTAAAMALLFIVLRRLLSPAGALAGTALAALGTSSWSVSANALWTHGPAQLTLTAGMLAVSRRRWLLAGLAFGAGILARADLAVVPLVVGIWLAVTARRARPALLIGAGAAVGVALLLYYDELAYGSANPRGGYPGLAKPGGLGFGHFLVNIAGSLVSPARGVLILSPFLLALIPGLRRAWAGAPDWARASAAAGLAYALVQLWLVDFSGGANFYSYRLMIEPLTLAAPLLAIAYRDWTATTLNRRRAFAALAALSLLIQAAGAFFVPAVNNPDAHPWSSFDFVPALRDASAGELALLFAGWACLVAWLVVRLRGRGPALAGRLEQGEPVAAQDQLPTQGP